MFLSHITTDLIDSVWIVPALMAVIFLILEIMIPGTVLFLSIALGLATISATLFFQLQLFFALTLGLATFCIGFWLLRRLFKSKNLSNTEAKTASSNVDALVGTHGTLIKAIGPCNPGRVILRQEEWVAISRNEEICKGQAVLVISIVGNQALVKRLKDTAEKQVVRIN
jgi:membrane protein implicated in regulation of membrane protease activity